VARQRTRHAVGEAPVVVVDAVLAGRLGLGDLPEHVAAGQRRAGRAQGREQVVDALGRVGALVEETVDVHPDLGALRARAGTVAAREATAGRWSAERWWSAAAPARAHPR
jgi:hypothetical protein